MKFLSGVTDQKSDIEIQIPTSNEPVTAQVKKPRETDEHNVQEPRQQVKEDAAPHALDCNEEPEQETENRQDLARDHRKPKWLKDYVEKVRDSTCDLDFCYRVGFRVPEPFEQVKESDDSFQWKQAIDEKLESVR